MNPFHTEEELAAFTVLAHGPFGFVGSFHDRLACAELRGWSKGWRPNGDTKRIVTVKVFAKN